MISVESNTASSPTLALICAHVRINLHVGFCFQLSRRRHQDSKHPVKYKISSGVTTPLAKPIRIAGVSAVLPDLDKIDHRFR